MPDYRDYYGIARRQRCSRYIAGCYEAHAIAAINRGERPMPCSRWIRELEQGVFNA